MFSRRALAEAPPAQPEALDEVQEMERFLDDANVVLEKHSAEVAEASREVETARAVESRAQAVFDAAEKSEEEQASLALTSARQICEKRERHLAELRGRTTDLVKARYEAAARLAQAMRRQEGNTDLEELEGLTISLEAHAEAIRAAYPRAVHIEEQLAREGALSQEKRHEAARLRARGLKAVHDLAGLVGLTHA